MQLVRIGKYAANTSHPTIIALYGVLSAITLYSGGIALGHIQPFFLGLLGMIVLFSFRLWVFVLRFQRLPRAGFTFFREALLGVLLPQAALVSSWLMFVSTQFPKMDDGVAPGLSFSVNVFLVALLFEVGLTFLVEKKDKWRLKTDSGIEAVVQGEGIPESEV